MTTAKRTNAKLSPPKDGISYLVIEFDPDSDGYFLYTHETEGAAPKAELWFMTEEDAMTQANDDYGVSQSDWSGNDEGSETPTRDVNGTILQNGDDVTLIKDLDVKGAGVTIKRGTTVKNISLTNNPEQIDCRTKEVKNLVLLSCFVKKL